jgi:hypothetical protein
LQPCFLRLNRLSRRSQREDAPATASRT